jgi:hypothetical protein
MSALPRIVAFVLLSLALAPAPVFAQDNNDPGGLEELRSDLKREGLLRLIEMAALATNDAERARLIRSRRSLITDEFINENGALRDANKALEKIFARDIATGRLTKSQIKIDGWYAGNYRSAFRVTEIAADRMPLANGYTPPVRSGYLAEVGAIDTNVPHSMTDLRDYLGNRFTLSALDRIVKNGHAVEFHVGEFNETMTSLKNRGYKVLGEVKSANGSYERVFMASSPGGEVTYAVTGINGLDRLRHLSSLMRFAGPDGGVAAEKVKIFGDIEALKERNYKTFKTALSNLGEPSSMAWIGFRGGVNKELTRRALALEGMSHVTDVLGSSPFNELVNRLEIEHERAPPGDTKKAIERVLEGVRGSEVIRAGLSRSPGEVFKKADHLERYLEAEKALGRLATESTGVSTLSELMIDGHMKMRGGGDPRTLVASRTLEHRLFRAEELRVRTRGGATRSLKLINNYYGDVMGDMARALVDSGHRKVAYFGTAGGLGANVRIGDVHVPGAVYDHDGRLVSEGLNNRLVDHLGRLGAGALEGRVSTNTRLANVFSPTVETMPWLENARRAGMASVEVENSYLAKEISRYNRAHGRGQPVEFMTSVMISDVLATEHTLGNNNGSTEGLFERMIDHYIDALGIEGIELLEKSAVEGLESRVNDAHDKLARSLLGEEASSLLRENVRALLKDGLSVEAAERALSESKTLAELGLRSNLRESIGKEIASGYSDKEVVTSIEKINSVLSRALAEMNRVHRGGSFDLRLGGGIERGRYSPETGLTVDFRGEDSLREKFGSLLKKYSADLRGPGVKLGAVGEGAIALGRGELILREYGVLERLHGERLLSERGVNFHKSAAGGRLSVTYRRPIEMLTRANLSRAEVSARTSLLETFKHRLGRRGAIFERVAAGDSRLAGAEIRTIVEADGRLRVLLAREKVLTNSMVLEELVRVNQLSKMREALGVGGLKGLLDGVKAGLPDARARYASWEIKAREGMLLTMEAQAPERAAMERRIEILRLESDPYLRFRNGRGSIDFSKVKEMARTHGAGVASFTLGIFLKELARVVETGDKVIIEEFFAGLATTDFWLNYGLFSIGAEAGTIAYTRFLERFVRPSFVSGLLKSNIALATGMALSEIMTGHFHGKTFAINVSGLMLSSTAVKAGLSGLRWVTSLKSLRGSQKLIKALRLGSAPGWIYAGFETAVVLYFGEKISQGITSIYERHKAQRDVEEAIANVLGAAGEAESMDDARLLSALGELTSSFSAWRNLELGGALYASDRLRADLTKLGHDAMKKDLGFRHSEKLIRSNPGRYGALKTSLDRLIRRHERDMDGAVKEATDRYYGSYSKAINDAYMGHKRGTAFDPRNPGSLSRNRGESYDDEAAVLRAAANLARRSEPRKMLLERLALISDIKARDRDLLIKTPGLVGAMRGVGDE